MTSETKSIGWHLIVPLLFVTLYGSGFVGAKLGLPYAPPLTFLAWRFCLTTILLIIISFILQAPWPRRLNEIGHIMVAGLLMLGMFSAGVFVAINLGLSPAISALIIALQPILVAVGAGPILGETIGIRQWIGFCLGLIGVALVVSHKLTFNHTHTVGVLMNILALLGLTAGNLYQKRFCANMNIFTGGAIQSLVTGIIIFIFAMIFESMKIQWTGQFVFALLWMSIVVSIGALSLLYMLIRHGEATQVASIFYLVPVSTAIISFLIYKDTIDFFGIIGIIITSAGIILVNMVKKPHAIFPVFKIPQSG